MPLYSLRWRSGRGEGEVWGAGGSTGKGMLSMLCMCRMKADVASADDEEDDSSWRAFQLKNGGYSASGVCSSVAEWAVRSWMSSRSCPSALLLVIVAVVVVEAVVAVMAVVVLVLVVRFCGYAGYGRLPTIKTKSLDIVKMDL